MRAVIIAVAAVIAGCAQMSTMYSTCEQQHARFGEVAACTKSAIKADSRYSFHNGYIANANRTIAAMDMLEEKVAAGAMTEKEARFKMHELMAAMRAQMMAEVFSDDVPASSGGRVRTNCQIDSYTNTARCVSR